MHLQGKRFSSDRGTETQRILGHLTARGVIFVTGESVTVSGRIGALVAIGADWRNVTQNKRTHLSGYTANTRAWALRRRCHRGGPGSFSDKRILSLCWIESLGEGFLKVLPFLHVSSHSTNHPHSYSIYHRRYITLAANVSLSLSGARTNKNHFRPTHSMQTSS